MCTRASKDRNRPRSPRREVTSASPASAVARSCAAARAPAPATAAPAVAAAVTAASRSSSDGSPQATSQSSSIRPCGLCSPAAARAPSRGARPRGRRPRARTAVGGGLGLAARGLELGPGLVDAGALGAERVELHSTRSSRSFAAAALRRAGRSRRRPSAPGPGRRAWPAGTRGSGSAPATPDRQNAAVVHPQQLLDAVVHRPLAGRRAPRRRRRVVADRAARAGAPPGPCAGAPGRRATSARPPRTAARRGTRRRADGSGTSVSRSMSGVLPYSANEIASRIEDLPAPIGPTMPTSRRSRQSKVVRGAERKPSRAELTRTHRPPRGPPGRASAARGARPPRARGGSTRRRGRPRSSPLHEASAVPAEGREVRTFTRNGNVSRARSARVVSVPEAVTVMSSSGPRARRPAPRSGPTSRSRGPAGGRPRWDGPGYGEQPGSTSTITTRLCSPASPKSRASSDPAYSAGTGAPGTVCGAWMCPIATYCGPGGIAWAVAA